MLIYSAICSLDGYTEDADGKFDWARPSDEVHRFVNDQERSIGTHLYGRRMYETMVYWETVDDPHPTSRDYAEIWRAADKVVYSRTLTEVQSERTRIEREFDPDAIRSIDGDVSVGGPELAAHAFAAGLVDRVDLFVCPVIVGAGKRALPVGIRMDLRLASERSFADGTVHLEYAR
ncbi:MAG TPA: dihydrofolate reductase family protein [Thermoleophilaceae bacterium]|nr:dihydrofolate reductase family protein [Thermoleophilaceae bacterium]